MRGTGSRWTEAKPRPVFMFFSVIPKVVFLLWLSMKEGGIGVGHVLASKADLFCPLLMPFNGTSFEKDALYRLCRVHWLRLLLRNERNADRVHQPRKQATNMHETCHSDQE